MLKRGGNLDEENLINKAKEGDKEALSLLLQNNYKILFGYLMKITGDRELSLDISQDTMLKAVIYIKKYKHNGKFSTFLITIATNLFRDYLRKNKKVIVEEIEDYMLMEEVSNEPLDNIINKDNSKTLRESINKLPYEKRVPIILKYFYDYKYEDIALVMKCPVGTIRSRLHSAVLQLLEQLKKEEE